VLPIGFGTCFGWLHQAAGDCGVLLCPAIGHEARSVHRPWRMLADTLAAGGYPTLRFDYPGTADSWVDANAVGDDGLAPWRAGIAAAADWLRREAGVRRIALCGLRLGAALAAEASVGAERLALLAPVVSGRLYLRELRALGRVAAGMADRTDASDTLEAGGVLLSPGQIRDIGQIDLRRLGAMPAPDVLILDSAGARPVQELAGRLRDLDAEVRLDGFPGYDMLMRDSHLNAPPREAYGRVLAWLDERPPGRPARTAAPGPAVLHPPGAVERPCRFGEGERLFGMLCEPAGPVRGEIAVIIGNTGGDPHYGLGDLSVALARRLAGAGVASLRMDYAGLGDSLNGPEDAQPHLFDTPRLPDLQAAMAVLEGAGYRRFVAAGICSGAYHALHAALADERVVGLYLVNLPKYRWRFGDEADVVQRRAMRSTHAYLQGLKQPDIWRRMLRREIHAGRITALLARRLLRRLALRAGGSMAARFPRQALTALSRRGVRTAIVHGLDDPGLDELEAHFGRLGRRLAALPHVGVTIVPEIDHAVSHRVARERAIELLLEHVRPLK